MAKFEKQVDVLLVEDNPDDVELALHAFQKHHFANIVHVCRDGVEAVDYLFGTDSSEVAPRLILLDFKMPRMNGLELLDRIRKEERTKRVPVIMLTASDEEPDMARSYDLGANSYIVKPVDFRQFSEVVLQLGLYWLLLNRVPGAEAAPQAPQATPVAAGA
jgi:two-component system, response regulator